MGKDQLSIKIALLEQNHLQMMEKLNEYQQENRDQHKEIKEIIEKALNKKANIWVEKVLIYLGTAIGLGLIGYLGKLIIKVIEKL